MTAPLNHTRMMIGYDNVNVFSRVSAVTLVNVSAINGTHENNLLYEDPSLKFETGVPSGFPRIRFSYVSTSNGVTLSGIFNWDGMQDWDRLVIGGAGVVGGPYTELVRINLKPIPDYGNPGQSFLVHHSGVVAPHLEWIFESDSSLSPLNIGQLVSFQHLEVSMNPDTGGIRRSRTRTPRGRRAVGGALHVARSTNVADTPARFNWSRMDDALLAQLEAIDTLYGDQLIGIIPPNQAGRELPVGLEHYLGRSLGLDATAMHGASPTTHASRVSWTLEGAI